jgi:hypothetical protein
MGSALLLGRLHAPGRVELIRSVDVETRWRIGRKAPVEGGAQVRHSPARGSVGDRPSGGSRVNSAEGDSRNPCPVSLPG